MSDCFPFAEKHQSGNRFHLKLSGQSRLFIDVDFADPEPFPLLIRKLSDCGGDSPAINTPGRPEINHNRTPGMQHLLFKICLLYTSDAADD